MPAFLPRIALTPGEPAGIGPDLCVTLAQRAFPCDLAAVADPGLLAERAEILGLPCRVHEIARDEPPAPHRPGHLKVLPVKLRSPARCGELAVQNAAYVLEALRTAVQHCLQGRFDALVTGPVHKGIINEAGTPFTGHTEFIAALTGGHPVMLLAGGGLRVALATTHLPLKEVSAALSAERLESVVRVLDRDLRLRFSIEAPRILVCALNPHAGEGGHLGREEIEVIEPVLRALRNGGLDVVGPLPADTLFTPKHLRDSDAQLAMYHDQGLAVLKYASFGRAVNITLGLPVIRTSVDHGTAMDLAGTGRIDCGSLALAITTALDMAHAARADSRLHSA